MKLGKKWGAWWEQVEERGQRKRQEDRSRNYSEHLLCPFAGIQKGPREHLFNYARVRDKDSFKHKPKTDATATGQGSLSHSKARRKRKSWNKYFWLRVKQAELLKFLQSCLNGTIHHEFKTFSHWRWQFNSEISEILTRGVMRNTVKELKFEGKKDWGLYGLELWKRLRCIQESNKD